MGARSCWNGGAGILISAANFELDKLLTVKLLNSEGKDCEEQGRGLQESRSKGKGCEEPEARSNREGCKEHEGCKKRAARRGLRGARRKGEGCEERENLLRRRKAETGGLLLKLRKRKSRGARREAVLGRKTVWRRDYVLV